VQSQYEIWPGPEERIGDDALILEPGPVPALLQNTLFTTAFEKLEFRGSIRVPLGKEVREFSVYLARNLKSWKPIGTSIKAPNKTSLEPIQERR
jgi:hypothetical protein